MIIKVFMVTERRRDNCTNFVKKKNTKRICGGSHQEKEYETPTVPDTFGRCLTNEINR